MQNGKQTSKDSPPFATKDGKVAASGDLGHSPGNDFVKDNRGGQSAPVPGHDFTQDNRSQSEAKPEVVPAKEEIPAGGAVLKLDPSGNEKAGNSGAITPVGGGSPPWKSLR
jgi:hypothetical protein